MAKPKLTTIPGYRITGTIKSSIGNCNWGHEAGDVFRLDCHDTGGLCGTFYHDIFPYIIMLQFGGGFLPEWGDPDIVTLECMDKACRVTIELRREK